MFLKIQGQIWLDGTTPCWYMCWRSGLDHYPALPGHFSACLKLLSGLESSSYGPFAAEETCCRSTWSVLERDLQSSGFQCPNSSSSLEFIKPKQLELTLNNRLSDFSPCFSKSRGLLLILIATIYLMSPDH